MDEILAALAEQHALTSSSLAALADADWGRPTRCERWSAGDVVLHITQTDRLAIESVHGGFDELLESFRDPGTEATPSIEEGADRLVARFRGDPPAVLRSNWDATSTELRAALAGCDGHERVQWVAGMLSSRSLAAARLAECWIHTGDVFGHTPSGGLIHVARLAWRTLPHAFSRVGSGLQGPVAFHLSGPGGEPWDFVPPDPAMTTISGSAFELCMVAGQRLRASETSLRGTGPDAEAVLSLVRTYA